MPERRRLWRVDLDAVTVYDGDGNPLPVDHAVGELDGPLVVHLHPSHGGRWGRLLARAQRALEVSA